MLIFDNFTLLLILPVTCYLSSLSRHYPLLMIHKIPIVAFGLYCYLAREFNRLINFLHDIYAKRGLIWEMSIRDLKTRYAGSFLGMFWIFIQPVITIMIFWFIFTKGFKTGHVGNFPFILWLACGMVPWFFFSEAIISATYSIADNSYLVKNVVFGTSTLPAVRIISTLLVHIFFMAIIFSMFASYGFYPDIYSLQLLYYLFATVVLLTGLSWITSASVLFFKDIGQFIQVFLQFLFWGTPIFWTLKIIPEEYHTILKLNPLYYIANGYRECFVDKVWLWQHPKLSLYFWVVAIFVFIFGATFFRKLKPHFGDVV